MDDSMNNEDLGKLFPILDLDLASDAILRPNHDKIEIDFPKHIVMCFFREVVNKVVTTRQAKHLHTIKSEINDIPYYEIEHKGSRIAFIQAGVGAPLAAMQMEKAIAFGARHFVVCGGCGVLNKQVACGHILVPTAAYREEGVSYHYLPASAAVEIDPKMVGILTETLEEHEVDYLLTKTWTTDAPYRETERKAEGYLAKGCLTVEMEAAALAAIARYRGVDYAQYLYAGDVVVAEGWDKRAWTSRAEIRESLFWLSVEACLKMGEDSNGNP